MLEKDISEKIEEIFIRSVQKYFKENLPDTPLPCEIDVSLEITKDKQHGDVTSNIAMRLARTAKKPPQELGAAICANFREMSEKSGIKWCIGRVEDKNGFINIWFSDEYYRALLLKIMDQEKDFGRAEHGAGKRVNLEFVSANPTGPLTIAHGRQAAIGDALSRILKFNGYNVDCEYYLNDIGRQITLLGRSTEVRYRNLFGENESLPEDGYVGLYVEDIAKEIKAKMGDKLMKKGPDTDAFFRKCAVDAIMETIRKDLDDFRVHFDIWTSQGGIETRGEVGKVLSDLEKKGYIYEKDGAKWFASTQFGDDKDRVVLKSDGSYTYLAPDISYHNDKYGRGYDKLIDLLGPDHHGYISRMKAAVQALGHDKESLEILIVQLVTLFRGGQVVSMSTRKAEFISLREVMDEVGTDVARFFFLTRKLDSHLDFDIDLAKKESADNPVFYLQYAHARIRSIQKFSVRKKWLLFFVKTDLGLLRHNSEKELMRFLADFPLAVRISAATLEPTRLIVYLGELARAFHSFYTECRVVSGDVSLTKARLYLVECVRIVLANGLGLLNISMPEKM